MDIPGIGQGWSEPGVMVTLKQSYEGSTLMFRKILQRTG